MAGEFTGVGLGVQTPDMLTKLSSLLTIKGQQAQVQQEQQTTRQRAALATYDWNRHLGDDGTIDLNTLTDPELQKAAGDQYPDIIQRMTQAKTAQTESRRTLTALRNDQREAFASMMNGLRSDKDVTEDNEKGRQKTNEAMIQFGEMYGEDVLPVLQAYAKPLQNAPKGRLGDALRAIGLQAMSAGEQIAAQQPQYTSTGSELTNVNPNAAGTPPNVALNVGPGVQILTDQKGAQFAYDPQKNTVTPVGQGKGAPAGPSAAPSASAFAQPTYPGQAADIENFQHEVANTRAAAGDAAANRNIFQHVLKLADSTSTGPLVSYLQNTKIGGQVFGDDYQELGKYLEKNAISNMQAMGGPPSDARLSAAVAANGSTSFNPKALKAVTQFNYATNTALEKYRQGLDKAVGTSGAVDYGKLPAFKAAWAKNFDIDAFRLENAVNDGDKASANAVLKDLTSERRKDVARKMANLDALSETGRLP